MTFNPNIPQSTDLISQSQGQFLTNFGQLNTIFDVDHVTYNNATVANRGKHNQSTYVEGSDPSTSVNEVAVYSKDTGTQPDLFYRPENNGTAVRLTGGGLTAAAWCVFDGTAASPISPGAAYNVSNITRDGSNNYTINFQRNFSSTNYAVLILPSLNSSNPIAIQVSQGTSNCSFVVRINGVASLAGNNVSFVCFGTLA